MTRDPFLRSLLIMLWIVFVAAMWIGIGWRALIMAAAGLVAAVLAAEDYTPKPPSADELNGRRQRPSTDSEGKPRDFTRLRG